MKTGDVGAVDTVVIDLSAAPEPRGGRLVLALWTEEGLPVEAAPLSCTFEGGGFTLDMGHPLSPTGRLELELPLAGRWTARVLPGTAKDEP